MSFITLKRLINGFLVRVDLSNYVREIMDIHSIILLFAIMNDESHDDHCFMVLCLIIIILCRCINIFLTEKIEARLKYPQ